MARTNTYTRVNQESTDFTSEWKAIVIKDVIEQELLSFTERDELWRALLVRREVAVLSWRWDTNDNQPSKNALAVIRYAKKNDNPYPVTYVSHTGAGDFGFLHMVSRMHGSVLPARFSASSRVPSKCIQSLT